MSAVPSHCGATDRPRLSESDKCELPVGGLIVCLTGCLSDWWAYTCRAVVNARNRSSEVGSAGSSIAPIYWLACT